jgi:hypothetical protein
MLYHTITLREGGTIVNLVVASATGSFPASPNEGEMFFRTDSDVTLRGLYCYISAAWERVASSDAITAPSGASFPTAALRGDLFYNTSTDVLYFYTGTAWTSTSSTFNVTGDVAGTLSSSSSTLNLVTVATAGTYGTASAVPVMTIDAKGRTTSVTTTAIAIDGNQVTSGTLADGRIAQSSVTQHQAALTILESQVTDGTLLSRNAGNETITGNWTFNNPVTGATPTSGLHLVTKDYADNIVAGFSWKNPVKLATTGNVTLSASQSIDSVVANVGDRVLVKNQTNQPDNGIYVVASGAWTRSTDMDSISPIDEVNSAAVFVQQGTVNGDTGWTQTATVTTIGTDPMVFVQFSAQNAYQAGTGLTLISNVFSLASLLDGGGGTFLKFARDGFGRVSGTTPVVSSDITTFTDSAYVKKIGDTMVGDLVISKATPSISLNTAAVAQPAMLSMSTNGSLRWGVGKNNLTESGTNSGSNFTITRYADNGVAIDTALSIDRAGANITSSGSYMLIGSSTDAFLRLSAASGKQSLTQYFSTGLLRWQVGKNNDTETGGNAGSTFLISRYADNGVLIDTPFAIGRATGLIGLGGDMTMTKANPVININSSAATQTGGVNLQTSNSNRWTIQKTNTAESGLNVGSDFSLIRYSDTGVVLSTALAVNRASGAATFSGNVTAPGFVGSVVGAASLNVLKTGDTMTGDLLIQATDNVPLQLRGAASVSANMVLQANAGSGVAYWFTGKPGNTLELGGNGNTEPANGAITILNTGVVAVNSKLGISTQSPSAALSLGTTTGVRALMYDNPGNAQHGFGVDMGTGSSFQLNLFAGSAGASPTSISFGSYNSQTAVYTERMLINQNGIFDQTNTQELGWRNIPPVASGFVRGACWVITTSQTVGTSTAGATFSVFNNSNSAVTLIQDAGVTLRLGGTTATGNRTLLPFGFATIWFIDTATCVINGNVT